jgi:hypothetical protein
MAVRQQKCKCLSLSLWSSRRVGTGRPCVGFTRA